MLNQLLLIKHPTLTLKLMGNEQIIYNLVLPGMAVSMRAGPFNNKMKEKMKFSTENFTVEFVATAVETWLKS